MIIMPGRMFPNCLCAFYLNFPYHPRWQCPILVMREHARKNAGCDAKPVQAMTPNLCRPKLSASSILFQTQHGYSQKTIPHYMCAVLSYQDYIWNCDPGHGTVKNRDGASKFWGTGYLLSQWVVPAFCYPRWQLPMCERMQNVKFPGAVPGRRCNLQLCPVTVWATAWDTGCDQPRILARFP